MFETLWPWVAFNLFVLAMLALDLGVFNRKAHEVSVKEALWYSAFWISLALIFGVLVYYTRGSGDAVDFITGYLIEKSLSVDNLFVLLLIFSYFQIPAKYQHRVLFWGIMGAIVLRMTFIVAGIALIKMFHWIIYLFGAFLVYSGVKMAFHDETEQVDLEKNPVLRLFRRLMPATSEFEDGKFFAIKDGKRHATPLFVTLLLVETSDVIFAMDSIPAIFAITLDPFIVYTSNIFAILGLRSLYFALSGIMGMFHYLNFGLSFILAYLGIKMLASGFFHIPVAISLGIIAAALIISVAASVIFPRAKDEGAGE
ncbi:MAG: TerC family protein [Nitrospinae bacterium]|nr:TerC family protein [Nitrospinota bacterium]MBF0633777.1 TerC family protein [Nitrospinota bacterium]